jgi:heme-degrading monooxygenase HmoA
MIYELRIYDVIPDRKQALYDRFAGGALALLEKHGFRIVDMWEPADGREKFFYILEWPDANTREAGWRAFRADPEWQKLKTESEAAGPITTKMEYWLLDRAPFWPRRTGA